MRVGIVGAGIVGLCTAEALTRRGVEVFVFDQHTIPAARSASNDRRRLLRHAYGDEDGFARLVDPATRAWHKLWQELSEDLFRPTGCLMLIKDQDDYSSRSRRAFDRLDIVYQLLDKKELADRYPYLSLTEVRCGVLTEGGGVLRADRILTALVKCLKARDVVFEPNLAVVSTDLDHGRMTLETGDEFEADRLIMAAGAWVPGLLPEATSVDARRQVVVHAVPPKDQQSLWQQAPAIVDFGGNDGAYVVPPAGDQTMTLGVESLGYPSSVNGSRLPKSREGIALLQHFVDKLNGIRNYKIERTRVCFYGTTDDNRWRVLCGDRGAAFTGCNGHLFKFGALLGQKLADYTVGDIDAGQLRSWAALTNSR